MENTRLTDANDSQSNDPEDEADFNNSQNETSSELPHGNGLNPPILGVSYRVPDIPRKYIEPTILDTSLPYIPIYTHLKIHELKPIERPSTPPILIELRSKCFRNDTESRKSSKATPSTGRTSRGRSSVTFKPRESRRSQNIQ
ncbi:uncharacterized protein LOC143422206 [Xylocopa sonorina]|uniref:uncharacterized protein LOC143422206 n=1 Tax=Xylocopa sonorina TaxID=1818115 RepID=UPI00403B1455